MSYARACSFYVQRYPQDMDISLFYVGVYIKELHYLQNTIWR